MGFDVVVLRRGKANQPDPDVIDAPGHVGLFAGREGSKILVLGGNQSDSVNVPDTRQVNCSVSGACSNEPSERLTLGTTPLPSALTATLHGTMGRPHLC